MLPAVTINIYVFLNQKVSYMFNLKKLLIALILLSAPLQLKSVNFTENQVTRVYIAGIIGTLAGTMRASGEETSSKKSNYDSYIDGLHNGLDLATFVTLLEEIACKKNYQALISGSFLLCKTMAYQLMRSNRAY